MKAYKLNKGFIIQKMDGKMTIFDGEKSQLLTFNETASFIFGLIRKGFDKHAILQSVLKKYKIQEDRAIEDVEEILAKLIKLRIIS